MFHSVAILPSKKRGSRPLSDFGNELLLKTHNPDHSVFVHNRREVLKRAWSIPQIARLRGWRQVTGSRTLLHKRSPAVAGLKLLERGCG